MSWENRKFIEFILLKRGHDLTKEQIINGIYPVITSTSIMGYHKTYKAKGPGVITGRSGTIGEVQYVKENYWPHNTSLYVKDFKGNYPLFVYYFMKNFGTDRAQSGSAVPTLNRNNLSSIDVIIPDIKTQEKIANILSAYDNLIENNQKQIKLFEEAAQRLYKEWFVDLRFPGYENTPIVDGVPKGWKNRSILDNEIFIFVKSGVSPFEGEKQYYATADITGTTIATNGETIRFSNKPSRATIQPLHNSVWFARMSNTYKIINCCGESAHLANDSIISSGFAGFTSLEDCYGFVYATIASKKFDEEKNRYASGSTQVSLTNEGLKKIKVLIPTIDITKNYSKIVESFLLKSELLKKNCRLLQQARDRLLPKLMSGELEV